MHDFEMIWEAKTHDIYLSVPKIFSLLKFFGDDPEWTGVRKLWKTLQSFNMQRHSSLNQPTSDVLSKMGFSLIIEWLFLDKKSM